MMRRRIRGEIASQMFIYILGIIVVALLLLLGFKAVGVIENNKCTVQKTQFETDLAGSIDKDKDYGVDRVEQFTLPCGAQEACFVSIASATNHKIQGLSPSSNPLDESKYEYQIGTINRLYSAIKTSIESGDETNVFIKTADGYQGLERFSVSAPIDLPIDDPIRCFSGDPLKIRFQGKGQTVQVT